MKKGSSHADWVISIGIFLISIIALFTFLQPGIEEIQRDDVMLDQVQTNFEENVFWIVKEVPLFINKLDQPGSQDRRVVVEIDTTGWRFSEYDEGSNANFVMSFESNKKFVSININSDNIIFEILISYYLVYRLKANMKSYIIVNHYAQMFYNNYQNSA